jgi:glycosyltransferase involved in cell wall biosynthesis
MIHERGMNHKQLWSLYAISDLFLLPSKAEGLGMPLLEAMSVGIPCMATDCTGMAELLSEGRGRLVSPAYQIIDPFGNGNRYMIDVPEAILEMVEIYHSLKDNHDDIKNIVKRARAYVDKRTWDSATKILEDGLLELVV